MSSKKKTFLVQFPKLHIIADKTINVNELNIANNRSS